MTNNSSIPARGETTVEPLQAFDFVDLLHEEFEPLQWIIPNYLPEGLTMLFARPKVGKSMLSLALMLRMARRVNGGVDGEVLYLTLDDTNKRRLQDRTRSLLQGEEIERGRVWGALQARTLDSGIVEQLFMWIVAHPATKLIAIDVYASIKPRKQDDDVFKSDYQAIAKLREFAALYHIAIILIHHTRKQADTEDWMDSINGSTGLLAAVDTFWRVERVARSNELILRVRGRDIIRELAVNLNLDDLDAPWVVQGEEEESQEVSATAQKILVTLQQSHEAMKPKQIAEQTGIKQHTALVTLRRLLQKNLVKQTSYGSYSYIAVSDKPCDSCDSVTLASEQASQAASQRVTTESQSVTLSNVVTLPTPNFGQARFCPVCKTWNRIFDNVRLEWECQNCVAIMQQELLERRNQADRRSKEIQDPGYHLQSETAHSDS